MLNPFLSKLLFIRQFGIDKGELKIFNKRFLLIPLSAFLSIKLNKEQETKFVKELKLSFTHLAKFLSKSNNVIELLENYLALFNSMGLGEIQVESFDQKTKRMILVLRNSTIAKEYINKTGYSKKPVCKPVTLILKAMLSIVLKTDVNVKETACLAMKNDFCVFNAIPKKG